MNYTPWIGVDLDGTLALSKSARSDKTQGAIGEPIPAMVEFVRLLIDMGFEVRIMTARVAGWYTSDGNEAALDADIEAAHIEEWCAEHIGCDLPVQGFKDPGMLCLIDDRAMQVIENTGERVQDWMPPTARELARSVASFVTERDEYLALIECAEAELTEPGVTVDDAAAVIAEATS